MIKNIIAALAISAALIAPAVARDDCKLTMTEYETKISKVVTDFHSQEMPENIVALVVGKLGAPPVDEPYTFSLSGGTVNDTPVVQLVIHDGDCLLTMSPVMPAQKFFNLLGLVDAGTNG